jgi:hypothetical protein
MKIRLMEQTELQKVCVCVCGNTHTSGCQHSTLPTHNNNSVDLTKKHNGLDGIQAMIVTAFKNRYTYLS